MVNDENIESPVLPSSSTGSLMFCLGPIIITPHSFQRKMYFVFFVFSLFLASKLVNILVFLGTNLILGESLNLDISDLPNCYNVT